MKLLFDIETNGFVEELTTIHSLVAINVETEELYSFADQEGYAPIKEGLALLEQAIELSGHNIIGFDLRALHKLGHLKDVKLNDPKLFDTVVASRLIYAHMESFDWSKKHKDMPVKMYGKHSLESWGYRLGDYKGDFGKGQDWKHWSKEMQDYCEQDVKLNLKLYKKLKGAGYSEQALSLEHRFAALLEKQMERGVPFDVKRAGKLVEEIKPQKEALHKKLVEIVPPFKSYTTFTPKRNNKKLGYQEGVSIARETVTAFNPGSRPQIVKFLKRKYRWQPTDFTDKGFPKVDREVLGKLTDWTEVPLILDYLDMAKLLGMLESGNQSWLSHFRNGRIYGRIIHNGAITGRCTHFAPNLGQIPSTKSYKGQQCRELFYAGEGYKIVGCDAKGLELRMLGHFLARYDQGAYGREVVEGDVHTLNQNAAGLALRDDAKRFIYAHNYGAGDALLGSIVEPQSSEERQKQIGATLRRAFELRIPSIRELVRDVKSKVKVSKKIKGLDGRWLFPRGQHMGLNTLLQGAGAVVMKLAAVLADDKCVEENLEGYMALHVHDEMQFLVSDKDAERVAEILAWSIAEAGRQLNLRVPLEGESKIGNNWAETH